MTAYYNEFDPFAAEWLRNLISAGLIAPGDVDERSITEVQPDDLKGYTQCHFFAGIGGWSAALRLAGWPDDRPVWTGSPPCQPFSVAGAGAGVEDERHLAPHFLELVAAVRPPVIFGEQVAAAVKKDNWIDDLLDELEDQGYATGAAVSPACGVGAAHIRQRLWFTGRLAEPEGIRSGARFCDTKEGWVRGDKPSDSSGSSGVGDTSGQGLQEQQCDAGDPCEAGRAEPGKTSERTSAPVSGLADAERQRIRTSEQRGAGSQERAMQGQDEQRQRHRAHAVPVDDAELATRPTDPDNSFWADPDWLFCRDGKWRPVESASQQMANGISCVLGRMRTERDYQEEIEHAAEAAGLRGEIMRAVREGNAPEEIWWAIGGCIGLQEATVLLAVMCEHSRELGDIFNRKAPGGKQVSGQVMQQVWRRKEEATCPPQGWGLPEQCAEQLGDVMSKLSQDSSQFREALVSVAGYNGSPLAHGVPGRVGRLRAYGNAIVPHVAAEVIRAIMECQP